MNPYQVLGIQPGADEEAIKAAYRQKAKETHPDHGGSAEAFQRVQEAYESLTKETGDWRRHVRYDPPADWPSTITTQHAYHVRHSSIICPGCGMAFHYDDWNIEVDLGPNSYRFHSYQCTGAIPRNMHERIVQDLRETEASNREWAERAARDMHVDWHATSADSTFHRDLFDWLYNEAKRKGKVD